MEANPEPSCTLFVPNPTTKRATRVKWSMKPSKDSQERILAYGCQKSLVVRDLNDWTKNKVFSNQVIDKVTCVKYSPNGNYIAFGDEKGKLRVIGWSSAQDDFITSYERDGLLNGEISDISWVDDCKKIVVVGSGTMRAAAINIELNSKAGDLIGHNASLLTCDIRPKPYKCIVSGEDKEIQVYQGVPLKHEKSIQKVHSGFVTKMAFNPWDNASSFMTISQDKSIKFYETDSFEVLLEKTGLHTMGINDLCFTQNQGQLVTCSSDRSVKVWQVDVGGKTMDQTKAYKLSAADCDGLKENVEKQILAVQNDGDTVLAVSCNSDINRWELQGGEEPVETIRGHMNSVNALAMWHQKFIISGDTDGRVLVWDSITGYVTRPEGAYKHKVGVTGVACNDKFAYTSASDMTMLSYEITAKDDSKPGDYQYFMKSLQNEPIKKNSSVKQMISTADHLYILFTDKTIEITSAANIEEVVKKSAKLDSLGASKGEALGIALSSELKELYVADDKGFVHVLDAESLEVKQLDGVELKTVHGHPCLSISCSPDGKQLAVGDTKGFVTLFDTTSKAQTNYRTFHDNKVLTLQFTEDSQRLFTLGFDCEATLSSVEDPKQVLKISSSAGTGKPLCGAIYTDATSGQAYGVTGGFDCTIRKWKM